MVQRAGQSSLVRAASTRLPTMFGAFDLIGFERANVDNGETEKIRRLCYAFILNA